MHKTLLFLSSLLFLVSCHNPDKTDEPKKSIEFEKREIVVLFNGQAFPWTIESIDLSFPYTGGVNQIGFVSAKDTISISLQHSDTIPFHFIVNQKDTFNVNVVGQSKPADYNSTYIKQNTGKFQVLSPKVHELINICIALTNIGRLDSNMVNMETEYYQKVIAHFEQYKNHAIIDSLNQHITEVFGSNTYDYYYNIRMNACMYSLEEGKIVNQSPYNRLGFTGENEFSPLIPLLENFYAISHFESFYTDNESYYQSLIDAYYQLVPISTMWQWLEARFPQRYQSYKIYFSPLIGGAHSTQNFDNNGFKETLMFIDAPLFNKPYSNEEKEAIRSRTVFTEIDHNYVNPSSDKFPEIRNLLSPKECWNNGSQGYSSSYATFNEYMTWALFSLYLKDNFDNTLFEKRNKKESDFMVNHRGFIKFKEFNDFILDWYKKNPKSPIEEVYPEIIEWVKYETCG